MHDEGEDRGRAFHVVGCREEQLEHVIEEDVVIALGAKFDGDG